MTDRHVPHGTDWSALRVCVAGIRVAGAACARALLRLGADVIAVDAGTSEQHHQWAEQLRAQGAQVVLGDGASLPAGVDVLVVSPGFPPNAPLIRAAGRRGVPVWGELELAWRLRSPDAPPWLVVTGTNGKTTTTLMLEAMLTAAGLRAVTAGNIGVPPVDNVTSGGLDAVAVEVSAQQLPFWHTVAPHAAVCLNVAEDHLDHFDSYADYVAVKRRIYDRCQAAAVANADDPLTGELLASAQLGADCRRVEFTLGAPGPGQLGVVDGVLVDRAFPQVGPGVELARVEDLSAPARHAPSDRATPQTATPQTAAPHNVANALAAAALARSHGVCAEAVRRALRGFEPPAHRIATVARIAGVAYVDDSKATNAHAAIASLRAYTPVVWIAGGLAKGQEFDDLVRACRDRIRAVVLLGADRDLIAKSLQVYAPDIPVTTVEGTDPEAMREVVAAAAGLARPGDTVLLAPGCASWDMFTSYSHRGDCFAREVSRLDDANTTPAGGPDAGPPLPFPSLRQAQGGAAGSGTGVGSGTVAGSGSGPLGRLRRVHLVGIGGSGMSGLAHLLLDRGVTVSGSDMRNSRQVRDLLARGATVHVGHAAEHVTSIADLDALVDTPDIPRDNVELVAAQDLGIPVLSRFEVLELVLADRRVISVAGTHGKTTTSSMITVALEHCGVDPSFAIGGYVSDLGGNSRSGTDSLFVVEADESNGAFLHTDPEVAIVTNVEPDHMFHWGDFEKLQGAFDDFVDLVEPNDGFALICVDEPGSRALAERDRSARVLTYGTDPHSDYRMDGVSNREGIYSFHVRHNGVRHGPITLQVPGYHNALNATAAFATCLELGYQPGDIATGLSEYSGTRRRFELVGEVDGVRVYDDYAHHPTELTATLRTARQCLDGGTLRIVFQPYRYHRTAMFTQEFADALALADDVVVMEVLAAGDPPIPGVSGRTVADLVPLPAEQVTFEPSRDRVVEVVAERSRPGDMVMTLGCGDVTELAPQIVAALRARAGTQQAS